jgi:RimJ/RimL family protein N-acetyltransferase
MRPMSVDDIETVSDWLQDVEDFALFDRTLTLPPAKDAIKDMWKADFTGAKFPTAYWFIVEGSDHAAVAVGGLQSVNYVHGDAVLPVLIARPARGQGLGLRVAAIMLDVAFDRLRLRRVTTFFRSDNTRTQRLISRMGFREEGRMRQAWFANGEYLDCIVVGILREEWYSSREKLRADLDSKIALNLGQRREVIEGKAD